MLLNEMTINIGWHSWGWIHFFSLLCDLFLHIDAQYYGGNQVVRLFSLDVSDSKNKKQQPEGHEPYWSVEPNTTFYLQYRVVDYSNNYQVNQHHPYMNYILK